MSTLDIHTPNGQKTYHSEKRVIRAFHGAYPDFRYVETDKTGDAAAAVNDGIIYSKSRGIILGVVETKCRNASIQDLENWHMKWLVTAAKIESCITIARLMRCKFSGFLFLEKSDLLLMRHIYDGLTDRWLVEKDIRHTETQATCNGGTAWRDNAFIDMTQAIRINVPK